MADVIIRPYGQADRDAVLRIAADTAFFGEPVETFLDSRELFVDEFCRYYTDYEPQHAWVADADGVVAGFLFGCVDTRAQQRIWSRRVLPDLIGRTVRGCYCLGRRTVRYACAALGAAVRGEFPRVDLHAFPAHLHINLDARFRGQGTGRRLIAVYLDRLRELGVPGVHLRTTSQNAVAVRLYTRAGFELLDARVTRLWAHYVREPVENRAYGLRLGDAT